MGKGIYKNDPILFKVDHVAGQFYVSVFMFDFE